MRHYAKVLLLAPFLVGVLLFALGTQYSESPLQLIGLGLTGVGIVILGADSIITRRASFDDSETNTTENYTGFSAVMWGVCFVLVGLALTGGAIIFGLQQDGAVTAYLGQHPGPLLLYAGAIVLTMSIPGIIGSHEVNRSRLAILGSVPGRLFALLFTLVAGGVMLVGIYELLSPAGFDEVMQQIQLALNPFNGR
jgi:hypothetical protein